LWLKEYGLILRGGVEEEWPEGAEEQNRLSVRVKLSGERWKRRLEWKFELNLRTGNAGYSLN
jgi:hypothetical protein